MRGRHRPRPELQRAGVGGPALPPAGSDALAEGGAVPATSLPPSTGSPQVCQDARRSRTRARPAAVPLRLASAAGAHTAALLQEKQTV